jgi:hypothetical protein
VLGDSDCDCVCAWAADATASRDTRTAIDVFFIPGSYGRYVRDRYLHAHGRRPRRYRRSCGETPSISTTAGKLFRFRQQIKSLRAREENTGSGGGRQQA